MERFKALANTEACPIDEEGPLLVLVRPAQVNNPRRVGSMLTGTRQFSSKSHAQVDGESKDGFADASLDASQQLAAGPPDAPPFINRVLLQHQMNPCTFKILTAQIRQDFPSIQRPPLDGFDFTIPAKLHSLSTD